MSASDPLPTLASLIGRPTPLVRRSGALRQTSGSCRTCAVANYTKQELRKIASARFIAGLRSAQGPIEPMCSSGAPAEIEVKRWSRTECYCADHIDIAEVALSVSKLPATCGVESRPLGPWHGNPTKRTLKKKTPARDAPKPAGRSVKPAARTDAPSG